MKTYNLLIILLFICIHINGQFRTAGVITGVGHTFVDIKKAIDRDELEEWDNVGVIIKATGEYEIKDELFIFGEVGATRLYYWEYKWTDGSYSGFRYRSEWTTNIQVHIKKYLAETWFIQTGPGIHIFNDGSGTVAGLTAAAGYTARLSDEISVPIGVRIESVFGNATPTALMLTMGFNYDISSLF